MHKTALQTKRVSRICRARIRTKTNLVHMLQNILLHVFILLNCRKKLYFLSCIFQVILITKNMILSLRHMASFRTSPRYALNKLLSQINWELFENQNIKHVVILSIWIMVPSNEFLIR